MSYFHIQPKIISLATTSSEPMRESEQRRLILNKPSKEAHGI